MSTNFIDITGERFGCLIALKRVGRNPKNGNALWRCKCDCGNSVIVDGSHLRRKITRSCGCLRRERSRQSVKQNQDFIDHVGNANSLINDQGISLSSLHPGPRNKSGVIGVSYDKATGKWLARLMHKGQYVLLKSFDTKQAAVKAREVALAKITKNTKNNRQ